MEIMKGAEYKDNFIQVYKLYTGFAGLKQAGK